MRASGLRSRPFDNAGHRLDTELLEFSAGNPRPVLKICTAAARTHCINDAGEQLQVPIRVVSRDEAMKAIHRRQDT